MDTQKKDHGQCQATHEEICNGALEHYDRVSSEAHDWALQHYDRVPSEAHDWYSFIPKAIEFYRKNGENIGSVSDGYHTFDELYEHRTVLFIRLCKEIQDFRHHGDSRNIHGDEKIVWRSMLHSDGTMFDGWFVLGINREKGRQITYHLPLGKWDETDFAEDLCKAPEFDGHTPEDVLVRIAEDRL